VPAGPVASERARATAATPMTRVALYGVSHWHARMHLDAFARAGAEIVALGDAAEASCAGFAPDVDCPRYRSIDALVEGVRPDFVMVMGRPAAMVADAERLIDGHMPFGIEKPLGRHASEGAALAHRAATKDLFATVPLVNRYSLLWQLHRDSAARHGDATVVHAHFRIINGHPGRYRRDGVAWVLDPEAHGGGALRNLGIHAADAFLQLCRGDAYAVVAAQLHDGGHAEAVESYAVALLRSEGGVLATIEAGYTYSTWNAGGDFEWRVASREAYLVDRNDTLSVACLDGTAFTETNVSQGQRYDAFAADVVARLRDGLAPCVSLADAVRAMELIDRVYRAAEGTRR
jgi:predicted dehydrogenase